MGRPESETAPGISQRREGPPPQPGSRWRPAAEIAFLLLLFAAAFLVRLWPIWQVHFWDEAVYLQNAKVICCDKANYSELGSRPPLLSLLYAGVFLLWHHDYAASLLVATLTALGPLFLYWAGKLLYGVSAGGISALLLAFSPFFVKSSNDLLTDNPALTLTLLAFCVLLRAVARESKVQFALAGFLCGMAGLMRFTSLITVFVFPLYLLRSARRLWHLGLFALGVGLGFGPYLLWSRFEYGSLFATLRTARVNVAGSVEPTLFYLQDFDEVFPWLSVVGTTLWFVVWLLDSRIGWEQQEGGRAVGPTGRGRVPQLAFDAILWWWALVVLVYFSTIPHKELRYIIPMAAPWFLLAGRGLAVFLRGRRRPVRFAAAGVLVLAMVLTFAPTLERFRSPFVSPFISEEKQVADYLNQNAAPSGVLYANFNYPVFGYYTGLDTRIILEQDASFYQAFPNNMPSDGYVILYKHLEKEPTPVWADEQPQFRRMREFPSLIVYEYRISGADEPG